MITTQATVSSPTETDGSVGVMVAAAVVGGVFALIILVLVVVLVLLLVMGSRRRKKEKLNMVASSSNLESANSPNGGLQPNNMDNPVYTGMHGAHQETALVLPVDSVDWCKLCDVVCCLQASRRLWSLWFYDSKLGIPHVYLL